MSETKPLVQEVVKLYTSNMASLVLPMLAITVVRLVTSVGPGAVVYRGAYHLSGPVGFVLTLATLTALALLIPVIVAAYVASYGMVASASLRLARGEPATLSAALQDTFARVLPLTAVCLASMVAYAAMRAIPLVGPITGAVTAALLAPAPVLAMAGRRALDSLTEGASMVVESLSRRPEVPLAIFVASLVGALLTGPLSALYELFATPFAVLLSAYYIYKLR